jgi:hypothetical protein
MFTLALSGLLPQVIPACWFSSGLAQWLCTLLKKYPVPRAQALAKIPTGIANHS